MTDQFAKHEKMNATTSGVGSKVLGDVVARSRYVSYYGLALTIGWIGLLKFTNAEAEGIAPFVASSPFIGWTYSVMSHQALSNILGSIELFIAILIALRPVSSKLSVVGGFLATGMFFTTISFIFSTPGAINGVIFGIVPGLSVPGQFLLKDTVLLGVALQLLAESWVTFKSA